MTYADQVNAANQAYSKIKEAFNDIKLEAVEFRSSVSAELQLGLYQVLSNAKRLMKDLEGKLNGESIAREAAIVTLRAEILKTMEKTFTVDFRRRIPTTLYPSRLT